MNDVGESKMSEAEVEYRRGYAAGIIKGEHQIARHWLQDVKTKIGSPCIVHADGCDRNDPVQIVGDCVLKVERAAQAQVALDAAEALANAVEASVAHDALWERGQPKGDGREWGDWMAWHMGRSQRLRTVIERKARALRAAITQAPISLQAPVSKPKKLVRKPEIES